MNTTVALFIVELLVPSGEIVSTQVEFETLGKCVEHMVQYNPVVGAEFWCEQDGITIAFTETSTN